MLIYLSKSIVSSAMITKEELIFNSIYQELSVLKTIFLLNQKGTRLLNGNFTFFWVHDKWLNVKYAWGPDSFCIKDDMSYHTKWGAIHKISVSDKWSIW